MAPRRGGSSSGGGGYDDSSTICEDCSAPLYLNGSDWQDGWSIPCLVIACISLAVYLYAARLCFKHLIIRNGVKHKWMTRALRVAVVFAILACCLFIVETILYEERTSLTQAYYIEYIFHNFILSVAEFLLLIPVTYMVLDHALHRAKILRVLKLISWTTLLAILGASIASVVGSTLYNVMRFADLPHTEEYYYNAGLVANLTYVSLYTAFTLQLLALAGIMFARSLEIFKLRVFWATLTTFLFLRNLFGLIYVVSSYIALHAAAKSNTTQPNLYTYDLLGSVCFTLLGLIVREQQVKGDTGGI